MIVVDYEALSFHPKLHRCNPRLLKKIKNVLASSNIGISDYIRINAPFVVKDPQEHHQLQLLSHHHSYLLARDLRERSFYAWPASKNDIDNILAVDGLHSTLLERALLDKQSISSQTRSHRNRRTAGQVCPFCPGVLTGQKSKTGKNADDQLYFEVNCHYRHYKNYNCDFSVRMTEEEFLLFKKNQYPTYQWLTKLDNKRCPLCKDHLYERKLLNGRILHVCRKTLRKKTFFDDHCSYQTELTL